MLFRSFDRRPAYGWWWLLAWLLPALGAALAGSTAQAQGIWGIQTLASFAQRTDGVRPATTLVRDASGALYGATLAGGKHNGGRVFKLDPPAAGQPGWTETPIYDFPAGTSKSVTLLVGRSGTLYGTLSRAVSNETGFVFALVPPAAGATVWSFQSLASFHASLEMQSGASLSSLIEDDRGALYGTAETASGSFVYRLSPPAPGAATWVETDLVELGRNALVGTGSGVAMDATGALYGTTYLGGKGWGTLYKLTPPTAGAGSWTQTVLYEFDMYKGGGNPISTPVLGPKGTIYGVAASSEPDFGLVFEVSPPGPGQTAWQESVIYWFPSQAAYSLEPVSGDTLVLGPGHTLYTMLTQSDGTSVSRGPGALLQLTPPAGATGLWTASVVHNFGAPGDGVLPQANVLVGAGGLLYGTAARGGVGDAGVVFQLDPPAASGRAWQESILYSFMGGSDEGVSAIAAAPNGAIYGVSPSAGPNSNGVVFGIAPQSGGSWQEAPVHAFTGWSDGANPDSLVIDPASGTIYGTTLANPNVSTCADDACGSVYELTPPPAGKTAWTRRLLHSFAGQTDGGSPGAGLVLDAAGHLFGTMSLNQSTAIFELTPPPPGGTRWTKSTIYPGTAPNAITLAPTADPGGHLYGTASGSGSSVVFRLTPPAGGVGTAKLETLLTFGTQGIGASPIGGVVRGAKGVLFGVAADYPSSNQIFELLPPAAGSSNWTAQVIFTLGTNDEPTNLQVSPANWLYFLPDSYQNNSVMELAYLPGSGWSLNTLYYASLPDQNAVVDSLAIDKAGALYTVVSPSYTGGPNAPTTPSSLIKLTPLSLQARPQHGPPRAP